MPDFSRDSQFNADKSFNKVRFGEDAPLLEVELNELQDIQNHLRASLIRKLTDSGVLKVGGWVSSDSPGEGQYGNGGVVTDTIYFGRATAIVNGYELTLAGSGGAQIAVSVPAKPGSGIRTDLIFLEVWFEEIDSGETLNKFGGKNSGTLTNDLQDSRIGAETSRRVQLKWQYRSVSGVDFSTYPDGVDDPTVKARGAQSSNTPLSFSQDSEDPNLFIAGTGSFGDKLMLGTVDGFSYAIPIMKVTRNSTEDVIGQADVEDKRPGIELGFNEHVATSGHVHIGASAPSNTNYVWVDTSV